MKKNRFNKDNKINLTKKYSVILIISIISIVLFTVIYNLNKGEKGLNITETANVDYKVYLKENSFYKEEYMEANKQYIDNLTKNITANYNYNLNSDNKKEFDYTYRIDAIIDIVDNGTKKSLYTHTENLLEEKTLTSKDGKISINEETVIDYKHFNDISKKFIKTYSLTSTNTSNLKVNLVVKNQYMKETVVTLLIPLSKNTFDITTSNQLASKQGITALINQEDGALKPISIIGILSSLCVLANYGYKLIKHLSDSRTDEEKYKSNVRKILVNYGGYINKTDDFQFNLDEYEIIRVSTFMDLLKIKEDLSRPILMIENKEKTSVVFTITDSSKFIYMYALNMYQKKLAEKNEHKILI